jgi:hypothetical protein
MLLTQHLGRLHMLYYMKRSNASIYFQCVLYPVEAAAHGWTQRVPYLLGLGIPLHFAKNAEPLYLAQTRDSEGRTSSYKRLALHTTGQIRN